MEEGNGEDREEAMVGWEGSGEVDGGGEEGVDEVRESGEDKESEEQEDEAEAVKIRRVQRTTRIRELMMVARAMTAIVLLNDWMTTQPDLPSFTISQTRHHQSQSPKLNPTSAIRCFHLF